ncbi:serine hydrolase domain-containing protein [Chryseobacterium daecheongense]|uniref:Class A beta-lactamase-related serine hydrolase n=1 Tax=Chryseobacterium daecheongense TaxID=192389 RepID=A0A3N0W5C8_9FLAO|nr:serine hydrolase domain-containing protein [Chryseobacterium daecheongense]ROI00270.1 class A beta-lactamase-related serine hydrolase [Chryseobacterium daecheongense]TDX94771.1 D-alanyl-D-alanine carboxypeptidase [Chryseobacterium daecheongense]
MNTTKKYITLLFLLLFSSNIFAQTIESMVQKLVDSVYAANPKAAGFALYVEAPDQHLSFGYAVGYSNRETKQKLTADQPVLIASPTKPYVAAAILRLVEKGKLDINQPIKKYLTPMSEKVLSNAGYKTNSITLKHLLSHTSGIRDYVDEGYFKFIGEHPKHEWTRDEQIERAAGLGKPLSDPGEGFHYADINFVLLTEVIESVTHQQYYKTMRKLLGYKKQGLKVTRFAKFENAHKNTAPQAHQYWDEFGWGTYNLDPSWDLYGGGGIVTNVKEMAVFFQQLFGGKIIKNKNVLAQMTTDVPPNLEINYCLGVRKIKYAGLLGYNHGGGLGTDLIYIPQLNASIAVVSLEAGHRPIAVEISKKIVGLLKRQ